MGAETVRARRVRARRVLLNLAVMVPVIVLVLWMLATTPPTPWVLLRAAIYVAAPAGFLGFFWHRYGRLTGRRLYLWEIAITAGLLAILGAAAYALFFRGWPAAG